MKQFIAFAAFALLFVGCSQAAEIHTETSTEATAVASVTERSSGLQLFQPSQESRFIEVAERSIRAQLLLFARAVPDGEARLQPISFDEEDREAFRCVVREMRNEGLGDYIGEAIALNEALVEHIETTPDLTIVTLEADAEFQAITDQLYTLADGRMAGLASINTECGVMELSSEKLTESGAMTMMMEAMAAAED